MKKTIVLIALFIGFMGFSQESKTYQADAVELVKLQTKGQFEVMVEPYLQMIPEEKRAGFMTDVKAALPSLYERIAKIYMETYSHEEIRQIMDFYNSPIGKKMVEMNPVITQQSMMAAQSWGMELRPLLSKYTK